MYHSLVDESREEGERRSSRDILYPAGSRPIDAIVSLRHYGAIRPTDVSLPLRSRSSVLAQARMPIAIAVTCSALVRRHLDVFRSYRYTSPIADRFAPSRNILLPADSPSTTTGNRRYPPLAPLRSPPFFPIFLLSRMRPIPSTPSRFPSSPSISRYFITAQRVCTHFIAVPHYGNTSARFCQHQLPFKSAPVVPRTE